MKSGALEANKKLAVAELTKFLTLTSQACKENGWKWHFSDDKKETEIFVPNRQSKVIAITRAGLHGSIYGSYINALNRFWHDITHRVLNLGYTLDEERVVIQSQLDSIKLHGLSTLAQEMFWYDMFGQAYYYDCNGCFVENQSAFVDSCLQHGIKTACIARH